MADIDLKAMQEEPAGTVYTGTMKISVVSSIGLIPVANATVTVSYTGDPDSTLAELTTDISGQTPTITLEAPPLDLSLDPEITEQPYSEYNIKMGMNPFLSPVPKYLPTNYLSNPYE